MNEGAAADDVIKMTNDKYMSIPRKAALVLAGTMTFLAAATAQTAAAPAFAVVTIHPSPQGPAAMVGMMNRPDGIHAENISVLYLVRSAYGQKHLQTPGQIVGAPEWAKTENFHVDAKMDDADIAAFAHLSNDEQRPRREALILSLLVDRFHLKAHFETRQLPVYELVIAKGGPKLTEFAPGGEIKLPNGKPATGSFLAMTGTGVKAQALSMEILTNFLAGQGSIGRPVVDKTGLTGKYNFELHTTFTPMIGPSASMAPADGEASIFTALQDDLGLKLQPTKGPVEVLVIDQIEKPTEN